MVQRNLGVSRGCLGRVPSVIASLALLAACAGGQIPVATPADAQRAAATRPETTLAELEQGRAIYVRRCSGCHRPIVPAAFPPAEWPAHVATMKARARLEPEEEQLVLLYLVTMAASREPTGSTR